MFTQSYHRPESHSDVERVAVRITTDMQSVKERLEDWLDDRRQVIFDWIRLDHPANIADYRIVAPSTVMKQLPPELMTFVHGPVIEFLP